MSEEKSALVDAWHDFLGPLPQAVLDAGKKTHEFFDEDNMLRITPEIEDRRKYNEPQDRFEDIISKEDDPLLFDFLEVRLLMRRNVLIMIKRHE